MDDKQTLASERIKSGGNLFLTGKAGCVDKDTEFLTPNGWKKINEYAEGDLVATYTYQTDSICFEKPQDYVKKPCGGMYHFFGNGIDMMLSEEHRVVYWPTKTSEKPKIISAEEAMKRHTICRDGWSGKIKTTFIKNTNYLKENYVFLNEGELRLQVAVMADGRIVKEGKDNYTQMRFNKKRKYTRLLWLCNKFNLKFDDRGINNQGQYEVIVWPTLKDKLFDEKYWDLPQYQLEIIAEEVQYWDSNVVNNKTSTCVRYFTIHKENADFIQYVFACTGKNTSIFKDKRQGKECYTVRGSTKSNGFRCMTNKNNKKEIAFEKTKDGYKYCFTVSTTFWVARRNNKIFITGNTGKSTTINNTLIEDTIITSSTGISALNVGGETAHSVFALPIGVVTDEDLKKTSRKFNEIFGMYPKRIIIDEVSMLRADSFDLIDHRLKTFYKNNEPFGGLQVIVVGDCYQLPPIVKYNEKRVFSKKYLSPWFFTTKAFKNGNFETIELDKVYRQDNIEQIEALNLIRDKNEGWENAVDLINQWGKNKKHDVEMMLCSYNTDADEINQKQYDILSTQERIYEGKVTGNFKESDCITPRILKLKEGCRVMITANSTMECEDDYKNGLVGTVTEMHENYIYVDTDRFGEVKVERNTVEKHSYTTLGGKVNKKVTGTFIQFPLRLGYAISIHKSQGVTLDSVAIDFGEKGAFTSALAYVALSRVRDLTDMHLIRKLRYDDVIVDPKVKRFMSKL